MQRQCRDSSEEFDLAEVDDVFSLEARNISQGAKEAFSQSAIGRTTRLTIVSSSVFGKQR